MSKKERMRLRRELIKKSPFCFWCNGRLVEYGNTKDEMATLEHIIPIRLGGGDFERNIRLAHFQCNR